MKLRNYIHAGVVVLAATAIGVSCTDTWDEHYSVGATVPGATLWENMLQDEDILPFARVIDSCGYKDVLNSSQVFTVWAPMITDAEAQSWIDTYKLERSQGVEDDENSAVRRFIQNHIAMYNQQISTVNDSMRVTMLNSKRMTWMDRVMNNEASLVGQGVPSSNGMLYKLDGTVAYYPNIWERICDDKGGADGLDSLANYLLAWEREVLNEDASVPGGVDKNGKTEYLDSVMSAYNERFLALSGQIDSEDSLFWFVAPTNKVWEDNIDRYRSYFEYHTSLGEEGDSLQNFYSKDMFVYSSFFSMRRQKSPFNEEDPDSIVATTYTSYYPELSKFEWPMRAGGLLYGLTPQDCSNGRLYKASDWRIQPTQQAYMNTIKVEAEYEGNYTTERRTGTGANYIQAYSVSAINDTLEVSGSRYLRVSDGDPTGRNQPQITFIIPNTLSNCPYDIKVVFASPLAGDTLATGKEDAAKMRRISAYLRYYRNRSASDIMTGTQAQTLMTNHDVDATKMDTVTVATGVEFPVCNYNEVEERVLLTLESIRRTATQNGKYAQEFLVDCVIFEPHPEASEDDGN